MSEAVQLSNPKFTTEMKATHTLLVPQMAPLHFTMILDALRLDGYKIELLENEGPGVVHEGLQYVHNDACYPALLVIGQFIDALKHGGCDPDRTCLVITQTGGGCRASNYIHMLRKALVKAGFPQVPVASINFSNLEKGSGLTMTVPLIRRALAACLYGDELMALDNQCRPYETNPGDSQARVTAWHERIRALFAQGKGVGKRDMRRVFDEIAADFASIPRQMRPSFKVGIVGEIYVKYSPLGNNHLVDFLIEEGCEVNVPGLTGFVQYCVANYGQTTKLYGGSNTIRRVLDVAQQYIVTREHMMQDACVRHGFRKPSDFLTTMELAERFISLGAKMGEGWLLTGEMAELVESGFGNIVCAQPFGCLPNHVMGRGQIANIRAAYPEANITSIDYDPSATRVNQENRIKLMLSSAEQTA